MIFKDIISKQGPISRNVAGLKNLVNRLKIDNKVR